MKIEDVVKKYQFLAGEPALSKAGYKEAQELMRGLKAAGLSNEAFSGLSHGKWTPSTVKGYTGGIKAPRPSPWDSALGVLESAISAGIALDDVETTVAVTEDLAGKGVELMQVIDLLLAVNSALTDLSTVVTLQQSLQKHGLTIKDVADGIALEAQLEEDGVTLAALKPLVELVRKHGDPQGALEVAAAFASLAEIKTETEVATEKLENLHDQVSDVEQTLAATSEKTAELQESIDQYRKAAQLGFGQHELGELATLAGKHGGVKEVLETVGAFADYSGILQKTGKAEKALAAVETKTQQAQIQHGHLKTAVSMCQTLIEQHQFGVDAISTVFSIAQKFGEPLSVLKSVEAYGGLQDLQKALTQLQGKVAESEELLAQLNGKYEQELDHLESLSAATLEVGEKLGKLEERFVSSRYTAQYMDLINRPASADYGTYGPIVFTITASVLRWVEAHEQKFTLSYSIKEGLGNLAKALGGN